MADEILNQAGQGQVRSIVERAERLIAEKAEIAEALKEVFAEAKGNGFSVPILKKVIRTRRVDRAKRQEEEAIFDLYMGSLGELPLFKAAA